MEENQVVINKPKFWLAILAAAGMALLGCVLWGILYFVGVIAWIAAYVIILGACWAYKKINLKMDNKGYIIISILSLIFVALTMAFCIYLELYITATKDGLNVSFFEVYKLIKYGV